MNKNIEINGKFIDSQSLSAQIYNVYRSLIKKSDNVKNHINIIVQITDDIMSNIDYSISEKDRLVCAIHDYCENIYTCMEYIMQILRTSYKEIYRQGELKDGFNSVLKDIQNNSNRPIYIRHPRLTQYILKAKRWYYVIHDIRTEETHNSMGEIQMNDDETKLFYYNTLRRHSCEENYIKVGIDDFCYIYYEYCNYVNELDYILSSIINKDY